MTWKVAICLFFFKLEGKCCMSDKSWGIILINHGKGAVWSFSHEQTVYIQCFSRVLEVDQSCYLWGSSYLVLTRVLVVSITVPSTWVHTLHYSASTDATWVTTCDQISPPCSICSVNKHENCSVSWTSIWSFNLKIWLFIPFFFLISVPL